MNLSFSFTSILQQTLEGKRFSVEETVQIFNAILLGRVPSVQIAAFLAALRLREETVEELEGAVRAMRQHMLPIQKTDPKTIDVCGTGGDGRNTLNVSTAVSFVLAALGVSVAKHGNRAQSSRSGGVDVLAALRILPESDIGILQNNLNTHKLTFLSAFIHHPALKEISTIRKEMGVRTLFNLLGPLSNPAQVNYQMIGVYDVKWLKPLTQVSQKLGAERVWTVHGLVNDAQGLAEQGVDEITLAGPSQIYALENDKIIPVTLTLSTIEAAGLMPQPLDQIQGGTPEENAVALISLLQGQKGAYRDTVLINTAIALHVVSDYALINSRGEIDASVLKSLIDKAAYAIDSGAALSVLRAVQTVKNADISSQIVK